MTVNDPQETICSLEKTEAEGFHYGPERTLKGVANRLYQSPFSVFERLIALAY